MKKFILLSYSLSGMGGGQMYQKNKLNYMKKNGYEVDAIYSVKGEILIEDLKKYKHNYIEWLSISPILLSNRKIKKILKRIISIVGKIDNNTIIECNNKVLSMWGEILSKEYNSINFIYIIDEKIGSLDENLLNFFQFKRERKELAGIKEETYEMIFKSKPIEQNYSYILPLVCNNVIDEYRNEVLEKVEYSTINISTIGRLEKAYVPTLIEEVKIFAKNHPELKVSYIMVGGSQNKEDFAKIERCFEKVENLKLFLVGNIYPIPIDFLKKIDIFISSAGSARVSGIVEKPTITIDANDFYSIGILNYDTENTVFRTTEEKIRISEKLEFLYQNNFYKKIKLKKYDNSKDNIDLALKSHIERYEDIKRNEKKYFEFLDKKFSKIKLIEKIILNVFGIKIYQKIRYYIFKKIKY